MFICGTMPIPAQMIDGLAGAQSASTAVYGHGVFRPLDLAGALSASTA